MTVVQKHSLYNEVTPEIAERYSLFKLGKVEVINQYSKELANFIDSKLDPGKKYILYATNKSPLSKFCKKNSFLMAEKIAGFLKIPLLLGEYTYSYKESAFYDAAADRGSVIHFPKLKNKERLKEEGYKVIMIDDSIVTGTCLEASLLELKEITDTVLFFSVLKLDKNKFSETSVNDLAFKKYGTPLLLRIINTKEYVFTTHMLRTIDNLTIEHKREFVKLLDKIDHKKFLEAFRVYFEREFVL